MPRDIDDLLSRHKRLKDQRRLWESHWQELAEVMLPRRADFTSERIAGERRADELFDGTPMLARRGLASAIDGLLKPKTARWFRIKALDEGLDEDEQVKRWLEIAEERLYRALYDRRARFIQRSGEVDEDLVTFGTGVLFVGEGQALNRLLFRSFHLKDVVLAENGEGEIDTLFVSLRLTARQAAQRFGETALGKDTREALTNGGEDKPFSFLQVVTPRAERDGRRRDNRNLPFASLVIDVQSEHQVSESGYHEFPFAVPRWDTAAGEVYGRSPGMIALPDANTLQQMGKTLLVAGHKAVDPPLLVGDDSVFGTPKTFPGGITTFDMQAARDLGRIPIEPLQTGFNLPLGREMQKDARDQIWAAFFRNVLQLPVDAPRMTATEVLERKEEFIRTIGPVFGRLESDYIGQVVERAFNILLRAGAFPEPPEALQGREVVFDYASPVEQARRQIEAAGAARSVELLAPFVQADPSILDNFDGDAIARDTPEIFGMPQRWLRPKEEVEGLREGRQQAQQAAALPGDAQAAANIVQTLAQAGGGNGAGGGPL
ncbi:portal protein [Pelagibius sp.]|uniref:portal protein n=1 Tax=Pelagibius sp. TaxID=1931238 RepID=UPI00261CAF6A|nr:portal protein [Pelagibius sp.]